MNVKVKPKPKFKRQGVDFVELKVGGCFLWNDGLWIVDDDNIHQSATNMETGAVNGDMCGEYVQPVDVEIKWTKQ